jgi:2'-5' RNA ligase
MTMRAFVAVDVAEAVRKAVAREQEALRGCGGDVKWVAAENLHLTVKFLGELGDEPAGLLQAALAEEAGRWRPLTLAYAGLGCFRRGRDPSVVWAGCSGDVDRLAALAGAADRLAEQVGVPRETRPYSPHLTLGRVRLPRNGRRLLEAVEARARVPFGEDRVDRLVLYRSTLTPEGPVYEPLAAFPLGG